jgi:VanZ family protein
MLMHTNPSSIKGKNFLRAHSLSLLWAAVIIVLCVLPGDELPSIDFWELNIEDKLAHTAVFGVLGFLMVWGEQHRKATARLSKVSLLSIVFFACALGVLTELVQGLYIPTRYASFSDVLADALGAMLGTILAPWVLRITGFNYH